MNQDTFGAENWSTPQWLFSMLDDEFHFTVDAAASAENAKCSWFITKEDNALVDDVCWGRTNGAVFVNPPYTGKRAGYPGLMGWVEKAVRESQRCRCTVVMVLPGDISTQYFRTCMALASEIRISNGRIKFGGYKGSPKFGTFIAIFKPASILTKIFGPKQAKISFFEREDSDDV